MKTILITGATGLVGKSVLSRLLQNNFQVYCLGRTKPNFIQNTLKFIPCDLSLECNDVLNKLPKIDFAIHMAAHIGGQDLKRDCDLYQSINIKFTENLFKFCQKHSVNKTIFLSSLSILQKPLQVPVDENHPIAPATPYAQSKRDGELLLFKYIPQPNSAIIFRISSPLPQHFTELHDTVVKKWILKALRNEPIEIFGQGSRTQDFISTQDISAAILNALHSENAKGIYNIASGKTISMKRLAQIISNHFGHSLIQFSGNDPCETDRWDISISKARQELSFVPEYTPESSLNKLFLSAHETSHIK